MRIRNTLTAVLLFGGAMHLHAQTLEEWKAVENQTGVPSLPWSDLRDEADRKQDLIDDHCKTSLNCNGTKGLRENITGLTKFMEEQKKKRDEYNDKRNASSSEDERRDLQNEVDGITRTMEEKTRTVSEMEAKLKQDLEFMKDEVAQARRCVEAREAVERIFSEAIARAGRVSEPEAKAIAAKKSAEWEKGNAAHANARNDARAAVNRCERCMDGNE